MGDKPTIMIERRGNSGVLAGVLGCVFGVLGIFTLGIVFVPLAALCSVVGLINGLAGRNGSGIGVSLLGGALTIAGFVFSPSLWLLAGGLIASQVHESTKPTTNTEIVANEPEETIPADEKSRLSPQIQAVTPASPSPPTFVIGPDAGSLPRTGPSAWCRQADVIRNIMNSLSDTNAVKSANEHVIDFKDSTTTKVDAEAKTFSCHGIAYLSNGQTLPGTFSVQNNAAGDLIWNWMNDDSTPAVPVASTPALIDSGRSPAAQSNGYWYYCDNPAGYYPNVPTCNGSWREVAAQPQTLPPSPSPEQRSLGQAERCAAPPYGGEVVKYKAFINVYGPLLSDPVKTLSALCNAKFNGTDRKALYSLGFTDEDIDTKDTSDLGAEMMAALMNLSKKAR